METKRRDLRFVGEIVNLSGEVQEACMMDFKENTIEEFLRFFDKMYHQFPDVNNIGVMIPDKIHNGVILSGWIVIFRGWKMEEALFQRTGKPIFIQNDAHLIDEVVDHLLNILPFYNAALVPHQFILSMIQ